MAVELEDVSFQFLRDITDDFSDQRKLGEGAFGVVYKGVTRNGEEVAVKKLKLNAADLDNTQFRNEFYNLKKLKHQNIVQILGYCYETEKKPFFMPDGNKVFVEETYTALCFEYLCNGSLQKYLSDEHCERNLDWHTRFRIIKGTCEGLKHMHKDLEKHMNHLDLKPDNILLDKDMVPKIADFGLSMIFDKDQARNIESRYGTKGFQPPEHVERGIITEKFDIFSLGVVMIRIVSLPEVHYEFQNMSSDEFVGQVKESWRKRLLETCSNNFSIEACCHQVERCILTALECVSKDSQQRPDIVKIIEELNKIETDICKDPKEDMRNDLKDIPVGHLNIISQTDSSCGYMEFDGRETSSDIVEEHIVGRAQEKEKIRASLLERMSEKITILPIYGIGGIGKTTFARLIYNDPMFNGYNRVWVHVSQRFDLYEIRKSIISQLCEKESRDDEKQMIHSCLTNQLFGKEIIMVLDDIWEENPFKLQELKDTIYHDDSNIIILVTTRSKLIAERICTNLQPYRILPLTNELCWDIIKHRSGFHDRNDKEQLVNIGQEIAQKCGGLALAAQSLGFTLRSMNFDQWMNVKDNDIWNEPVSKDFSLSDNVHASLKLSYSYMSQCLKPCFTYCATFPKGQNIVKDDLIYQWISLGFIKPTKLLSNMEVCEKYIVQLLGLSFFQQPISPKTSDVYYRVAPYFTMHDLVHDLAYSLLGNQFLDQSRQVHSRGSSCQYALLSDCQKPLQMALTSPERLIALRFLDGRCWNKLRISGAAFAPARSLLVLDLNACSMRKGLPNPIGQLKQLRYLIAPGIMSIPECITNLSNLVYLNLRKSGFSELPESIGEMRCLMHLDLSGCSLLRRFPASFWNLERLVHLNLSRCSFLNCLPKSLGRLSRLQHLDVSYCIRIECVPREIGGLTELQYLDCSCVSCFGLQDVLVNLTRLRYLNLCKSLFDQRFVEAELNSLLEGVSCLSNLEYLNLGYNLKLCTIPETIGNLRKLNTIVLWRCWCLERLPACLSAINNLKFVHVSGCDNLDMSTLPQSNSNCILLPHFVVHPGDGESSSSNICELEDEHPTILEISRLENVKSGEEVARIKLAEKQSIKRLELAWTMRAKRFVDDWEVLGKLEPPGTLQILELKGYNGISVPSWMMSISTYLPHLKKVILEDLPSCNVLPPLGQLPNLYELKIKRMESIRKIDGDLYGGRRAFPQLRRLSLSDMECVEEWIGFDTSEHSLKNELEFPKLSETFITRCPLLRFKACSPPGKGILTIIKSGQVLLSSWENRGHVSSSFSAGRITGLGVTSCGALPLHQWSLLRLLPCITRLEITGCSDLTCSTGDLLRCISSLKTLIVLSCDIVALPERLGDLTCLKELKILYCLYIEALPDSVQQLSYLQRLDIEGCPELVRWCESEENAMKLAHIQEKILKAY